MDITSFILGIFAVIVVGLLAGITHSIFKIKEQKRINDGIIADIESINDKIESNYNNTHHARLNFQSKLDSRIDKLISRIETLEGIREFNDDSLKNYQNLFEEVGKIKKSVTSSRHNVERYFDSRIDGIINKSSDAIGAILSRLDVLEEKNGIAKETVKITKQLLND